MPKKVESKFTTQILNVVQSGRTLHQAEVTGSNPVIQIAGWRSLVLRQPHKLETAGSNPAPASTYKLSPLQERAIGYPVALSILSNYVMTDTNTISFATNISFSFKNSHRYDTLKKSETELREPFCLSS